MMTMNFGPALDLKNFMRKSIGEAANSLDGGFLFFPNRFDLQDGKSSVFSRESKNKQISQY